MKALGLLALLCFCMTCEAGWVILRALTPAMKAGLKFAGKTEAEAKKIVTALANGNLGKTFGFQESEVFFDHYVIREGGMYLATNVAAGGAIAAGVIVGVGVGAQAAVVREADAKESASISRKMNDMMRSSIFWSSMLNSLSLASVARDNERTSLSGNLDTQLASVQAAIDEATAPPVPLASTDERNVFHQTFAVRSDSIAGITPTPASVVRSVSNIPDISITSDASSIYKRGSPSTPVVTTGIAPLPPGTPFATATGISKRNDVPAEFPTYNLELCENDLVAMHLQANVLVVDTPTNSSLTISNVPESCMEFEVDVMPFTSDFGKLPTAVGPNTLHWDDVEPEAIDLIYMGFGHDPIHLSAQEYMDKYAGAKD